MGFPILLNYSSLKLTGFAKSSDQITAFLSSFLFICLFLIMEHPVLSCSSLHLKDSEISFFTSLYCIGSVFCGSETVSDPFSDSSSYNYSSYETDSFFSAKFFILFLFLLIIQSRIGTYCSESDLIFLIINRLFPDADQILFHHCRSFLS